MESRVAQAKTLVAHLVSRPAGVADLLWWPAERWSSPLKARRPWWPHSAIRYVGSLLSAGQSVLECGGGGSTLWLVDHGLKVTVIEHDPLWAQELSLVAGPPAQVLLREPAECGSITSEGVAGFLDQYVGAVSEFPEESFDGVIIDGRARVASLLAAIPKLRPGGFLVFDDTDRPRYAEAVERLTTWQSRCFQGLKGTATIYETTVYRKPTWQRGGIQ